MADLALDLGLAGVIATNTTIGRDDLAAARRTSTGSARVACPAGR